MTMHTVDSRRVVAYVHNLFRTTLHFYVHKPPSLFWTDPPVLHVAGGWTCCGCVGGHTIAEAHHLAKEVGDRRGEIVHATVVGDQIHRILVAVVALVVSIPKSNPSSHVLRVLVGFIQEVVHP